MSVDIDIIEELAEQMAPEGNCLSVVDSFDEIAETVTAFTRQGLQHLDELFDYRRSEFMNET